MCYQFLFYNMLFEFLFFQAITSNYKTIFIYFYKKFNALTFFIMLLYMNYSYNVHNVVLTMSG